MAKQKYSEHSTRICRRFSKKIIFHEISPKSFSQGFLLILRKFFENSPRIYRQISVHEFYQKTFIRSEVLREF